MQLRPASRVEMLTLPVDQVTESAYEKKRGSHAEAGGS
jgi:hypothetical protein